VRLRPVRSRVSTHLQRLDASGLSLVSKPKDSDQLRRKASPPLTNKQIFTATTGLIIGDLEISLEMLIVLKAYSFSVLLFLR
jgi:hypothetical protein